MPIVLRNSKGSELTHEELDGNFSQLVTDIAANTAAISSEETSGTQDIGQAGALTSGSSINANLWIYYQPVTHDGTLDQISAYVVSTGDFEIRIYDKSGNTLSQSGAAITVTASSTGAQNWAVSRAVTAGQYIGIYRNTAVVSYTTGYDWPLWSHGTPSDTSFNLSGANGAVHLQVRIQISYTTSIISGLLPERNDYFLADDFSLCSMEVSGTNLNVVLEREENTTKYRSSTDISFSLPANYRYDRVVFDHSTGSVSIITGTNQVANDAFEHKPDATSDTQITIGFLSCTSSLATAVEVATLNRGAIHKDFREVLEQQKRMASKHCRRFKSLVNRGSAVHIVGLGDSITQLGTSTPSSTVPNGTQRDAFATNYTSAYGAGTLASFPTYTALQLGRSDDGGGSIHSRIGWNWELVSALEGGGHTLGTDLTYDNFAVSGSRANSLYTSGAPTALLNAAVALGADLAVIGHGMNHTSGAGIPLFDDLLGAVNTLKTNGTEVVLLEAARPSSASYLGNWNNVNKEIRRVGIAANAPVVPVAALYMDGYEGGSSVSTTDRCGADNGVHPGYQELQAIGRLLTETVLG